MILLWEPRWWRVFPAASKCDGQELAPTGYITDHIIDGYENACYHVQPLENSVESEHGSFVLGASYWDANPIARYGSEVWSYSPNFVWTVLDQGGITGCYYNHRDMRIHGFTSSLFESPPDDSVAFAVDPDARVRKMGYNPYYYGDSTPRVLGSFRNPWTVSHDEAMRIIGDILTRDNPTLPLQAAYFEALSGLRLTQNSIANALEVIEMVKGLKDAGRILKTLQEKIIHSSTKEKASDLWLKYRYLYSTTKADISEIADKSKTLTGETSGIIRSGFNTEHCVGRIKVQYQPFENGFIQMSHHLLSAPKKYGLDPSLYNLWDMIPFSFVADWFLPIGDYLEQLSQWAWSGIMPYQVNGIYSLKCDSYPWCGHYFKVYIRQAIPTFEDFQFYDSSGTSAHTWLKRGLDLVSLI